MATIAEDPTVILSIARTPMGSMQGALSDASATDLGATAVKAAVERAGVSGEDIDRIYMKHALGAAHFPQHVDVDGALARRHFVCALDLRDGAVDSVFDQFFMTAAV